MESKIWSRALPAFAVGFALYYAPAYSFTGATSTFTWPLFTYFPEIDQWRWGLVPGSDTSGAAMRAPPLGVLPDLAEVMEKCRVQAAITHNTPDGIAAAVAAALMSHYLLHAVGPKKDLGTWLQGHVAGDWATPWQGPVGSKGWMSVRAAVSAVVRNDRLSNLLRDCVGLTGDVDTVAAVAMAAASCSPEVEPDLPEGLVRDLENGAFGRDYLMDLDRKLLALAGTARPARPAPR